MRDTIRTYKLEFDNQVVWGDYRTISKVLVQSAYDQSDDGLNKRFGNIKTK